MTGPYANGQHDPTYRGDRDPAYRSGDPTYPVEHDPARRIGRDPSDHEPSVRPHVGEVVRSLLRRAVLPGLVAAVLLFAIGLLIVKVLNGLPAEDGFSRQVAGGRTPTMDAVTHIWSTSTDTYFAIGFGILYSLLVWGLTRRWWLGLAPIAALTLESSIFVPVTNLTDRQRPPKELHLDPAPPTSSYPSGHTAAAFALYWTLALLACRIRNRPLRIAVQAVCLTWPVLVGYAREYRAMHHLSDIVVGALLGIWCAWTIAHAIPGVWPFGRTKVDEEVLDRAAGLT